MEQAWTRTTASFGSGAGSGTASKRRSPAPCKVAAFMLALLIVRCDACVACCVMARTYFTNPHVFDGGDVGCSFRRATAAISRILEGSPTAKCARPRSRVAWCGTGRGAACSCDNAPQLPRLLPQTGLRLTSRSRRDIGCAPLLASIPFWAQRIAWGSMRWALVRRPMTCRDPADRAMQWPKLYGRLTPPMSVIVHTSMGGRMRKRRNREIARNHLGAGYAGVAARCLVVEPQTKKSKSGRVKWQTNRMP